MNCKIDECEKEVKARGWCDSHLQQWYRHGNPHGGERRTPYKTTQDFIEAAVISETDECIIWPFGQASDYGLIKRQGKSLSPARAVLMAAEGDPGDGVTLHGPCHNRRCVNPRHLSWGSSEKNQADRRRDGTHTEGEQHPTSKLTEQEVHWIRAWTGSTQKELGRWFGVSRANISKIQRRKTWTHV